MKRWWHRYLRLPHELRDLGIIGLNHRNASLVLPLNPRRLYDRVDNKITTKKLAAARGIAIPETYGVVRTPSDVRRIGQIIGNHDSFVIKPTRGSGGKGVLVICQRENDLYLKGSGVALNITDIKYHLQNIIAGLFSLGGKRDTALIEARVDSSSVVTNLSYQGAPDIRIVILHGYPLMAMLRASTKQSDGRSNLHQGALGIGIDIATGVTTQAIRHGRPITHHPDLKTPLIGVELPNWHDTLKMAVTCHEMCGLGYLGVDLMLDASHQPIMIEINARPGLAIQLANGRGIYPRAEKIRARQRAFPDDSLDEKLAFSQKNFASPNPMILSSDHGHDRNPQPAS